MLMLMFGVLLPFGVFMEQISMMLLTVPVIFPPDTTMRQIYLSAFPFLGCSLLLVALLMMFPKVAPWLPGL